MVAVCDRSLGSDTVAVASGSMVCGVGFGGGVSPQCMVVDSNSMVDIWVK